MSSDHLLGSQAQRYTCSTAQLTGQVTQIHMQGVSLGHRTGYVQYVTRRAFTVIRGNTQRTGMKDAEHIGTVQQCHIYTSRIRTVEMHIGVRQGFEVLPAQVTHTTLVLHLA